MSRPRPVFEVFSEYAKAQGCTILESNRFISPDRKRSVRYSEARSDSVIVWDSGTSLGYVSLPREERRSIEIDQEGNGNKVLPDESRERVTKPDALAGQMIPTI
jgi:hypothetical protein